MISLINAQTLGAAAANIDITSIPGGYLCLWMITSLRSATDVEETSVQVRFNNDSGTNYEVQMLYGAGAIASTLELAGSTGVEYSCVGDWTGTNNPGTATFSTGMMWLPFYAATDRHKGILLSQGRRQTTITGGLRSIDTTVTWRNTAAINRITIVPASGNLKAGSSAALFGLH